MSTRIRQLNSGKPLLQQAGASDRTTGTIAAMQLFVLPTLLFCAFVSVQDLRAADVSDLMQRLTNSSQISPIGGSSNLQSSAGLSASSNAVPGSAFTMANMEALDNKYQLAIGDHVNLRIVEDNEEPKSLVVADSGEIEVPYLGRYPVTGKTCLQLARELKIELQKDYYYQATVMIAVDLKTKGASKIYLFGPVRAPGEQEFSSDEGLTLSKAILRAGGFSDFADRRHVRVSRKSATPGGKEQTFTVNVEDILEKGKIQSDLKLEPDDLITIPERLVRF